MAWTYNAATKTWHASEYSDLSRTSANNLIQYGQPYQPSDPEFSILIEADHLSVGHEPARVQMSQLQVMEFGYGSGVSVSDFGVSSLVGQSINLRDGYYTKDDLINAGLATQDDFEVGSQLYTPGFNIADGGFSEAYVHGTVKFGIGSNSRFGVVDGKLIAIEAEIRAFDDNFDFSSSIVPDWINQGPILYIAGPGNAYIHGETVILEYRGPGRIEVMRSDSCFAPGTPILLPNGSSRRIELVRPGDVVLSYDASGALVPGRVTHTFRNQVEHLLDVHGLRVTPGHVTLCGDGPFADRHVPILDILLSDGALVRADGSLWRMAIDAPVGSVEDAFVEVAFALTPEDAQAGRLERGRMRAGTLLFDRKGEPVSVLACLEAGGYAFDPQTGLVAREGEAPGPLLWFGPLPRPEDYILRRSRETLEGILTDGEWESHPSALAATRLRQGIGRVN